MHKTTDTIYSTVVLNRRSALIQWLSRVKENCANGAYGLKLEQYHRLRDMFFTTTAYPGHELDKLLRYIKGWRKIDGLPPELYPPLEDPTSDQFNPEPHRNEGRPVPPVAFT
jgi:hypothetical protein